MSLSTHAETISVNCEDFSDSFLTCPTCLCMYDERDKTPKLLPCAHTQCRSCLEKIVETQGSSAGIFRCPICRDATQVPRGGVGAFPPSFLINQLIDLISKQKKDLVPKCSKHYHQDLLFCETCDLVFCSLCMQQDASVNAAASTDQQQSHSSQEKRKSGSPDVPDHFYSQHSGQYASDHIVIPFSTALKRMSEIVNFKTRLCHQSLQSAEECVTKEQSMLEESVQQTKAMVDSSFEQLLSFVKHRQNQLLSQIEQIHTSKDDVLNKQLSIIQKEMEKLRTGMTSVLEEGPQQCSSSNSAQGWEVRKLTQRVAQLNQCLDASSSLAEPRENAFVKYDFAHDSTFEAMLSRFGRLTVSKTFPPLCSLQLEQCLTASLPARAILSTVDYHGQRRETGGDPIQAEVLSPQEPITLPVTIKDLNDGSYQLSFTPNSPGKHKLHVKLFGRPIKGTPISFSVSTHNNPVLRLGASNGGPKLRQPTAVLHHPVTQRFFVLDTGNSRICVFSSRDGRFIRHFKAPCLDGAATDMAWDPRQDSILIVNWRLRLLARVNPDSEKLLDSFCHDSIVEPVALACMPPQSMLPTTEQQSSLNLTPTNPVEDGDLKVFLADAAAPAIFLINLSTQTLLCKYPCVQPTALTFCVGLNRLLVADKGKISIIKLLDPSNGSSPKLIFDRQLNFACDDSVNEEAGSRRSSTQAPISAPSACLGGITTHPEKPLIFVTRTLRGKSAVQVFDFNGATKLSIDSNAERLRQPAGLCVCDSCPPVTSQAQQADGPNQNLIAVADVANHLVKIFRYA